MADVATTRSWSTPCDCTAARWKRLSARRVAATSHPATQGRTANTLAPSASHFAIFVQQSSKLVRRTTFAILSLQELGSGYRTARKGSKHRGGANSPGNENQVPGSRYTTQVDRELQGEERKRSPQAKSTCSPVRGEHQRAIDRLFSEAQPPQVPDICSLTRSQRRESAFERFAGQGLQHFDQALLGCLWLRHAVRTASKASSSQSCH